MGPIPQAVLVGGIVLVGVAALVGSVIYLAYWSLQRRAESLLATLPRMRWLTLEMVVEYGYTELLSRTALSALYEHGFLEVRLKPDLWQSSKRPGFAPGQVHQFEFRIPYQHPNTECEKKQSDTNDLNTCLASRAYGQ